MQDEKRKGTHWFWAAIGAITITVISDNISEKTKNIPVLNFVVGAFKWVYVNVARVLNSQIKLWIVLMFGVAVYIISRLLRNLKKGEPNLPAFYNYRSDRFKNWTWKWRWENFGRGWEVTDLAPYCSDCEVELSIGGSLFQITARCPSCGKDFGQYSRSGLPCENRGDADKLIRARATKMSNG